MFKRKSADKKEKAQPINVRSLPTNQTKLKTPLLSNQESAESDSQLTPFSLKEWFINY